ncbi:hypothetical protein SADUNF_Sadunf10G0000900 [Salix dunnii]|uniref:DUF4371 domain-containing protein n=1 Tax=Salix dunnii TaxID=1413687 RepID=A0A835JMY3_9ROSI|nr:hypothetical protein SADUNF_Sadunf10G0000900 [Salix dunnii]
MVVIIRYVVVKGCAVECFFGIVTVKNIIVLIVYKANKALCGKHELGIPKQYGQGYDGASNMQGFSCKRRDLLRKKQHSKITTFQVVEVQIKKLCFEEPGINFRDSYYGSLIDLIVILYIFLLRCLISLLKKV